MNKDLMNRNTHTQHQGSPVGLPLSSDLRSAVTPSDCVVPDAPLNLATQQGQLQMASSCVYAAGTAANDRHFGA